MEQQEHTTPTQPVKRKNPATMFVFGLLVILLIALMSVYGYTKSQVRELSTAPFVMQTAEALHVPIAKIDGNPVPYTEFVTDYQSLQRFYANQPEGYPTLTQEDIAQQALSRLLVNALVADFADTYHVTITDEDLASSKQELLSQFESEDAAAAEIQNTFGWSYDTFVNRVIRPIVLEQKVAEAFAADTDVDAAYTATQVQARHILFVPKDGESEESVLARAQAVLDRIKNGEDFAELAKEFGSDGTAEVGGDLGWIDRGMTVPSFEDVLFSLQPGELYDNVLKTEFGYHIVQAMDVRTVNDFPLFFQDQLKNARVSIYTDIANPFAEQPTAEDAQMEADADMMEENTMDDATGTVDDGAAMMEGDDAEAMQ